MKLKFKEILAFIIGAIAAAVLTYKLKSKAMVLPDIPKPVIRREVSFAKLANHLRGLFPDAYIQLSDSVKYLCDIDDINTFLKQDATDRIKYRKEIYDCEVPEEVAYGLGLFFADGTCSLREKGHAGASWSLVGWKRDCLERAADAFSAEWPDMKFYIREFDSYKVGSKTNYGTRKKSLYCLQLGVRERHNDGTRGRFIELFTNSFYDKELGKKMPAGILESLSETKLAFLNGVIDGDGISERNGRGFISCHGMMQLTELIDLIIDCGWKFYYKPDNGNDNYRLYYDRKTQKLAEVAACDDFAYRLKGQFSIPGWAELAIGIIWTKTHAQNCVVDTNLDFWVIEPQNDNLMGVDYLEDKNVRFIII